jgi:hypothetical protein
MTGIAGDSVTDLRARFARFDTRYVTDWNTWLGTPAQERPYILGAILRRWQACRPNCMRRTRAEQRHDPPYLEDLVAESEQQIGELLAFDIRSAASFTPTARAALRGLWEVFQHLSYQGRARGGLAGVVGISKAVMLLSDGRVGPAFDSRVRGNLGLGEITGADGWIGALRIASQDISAFEASNATNLHHVAGEYAYLHSGRIYDMALGPGT